MYVERKYWRVGMYNVQVVPEDAEQEDGYGQGIAAEACITTEELGDDLAVVF